ncbi:MAG: glutathione S-transferase family protein [Pseudolabrys sp.]|nr:glutathione S-transferase family protein [Pseudolabrys sp.]
MAPKLYYHPLSSFCQKALIAFYESGVSFDPVFLNLGDDEAAATLRALWPVARFPVLRDEERGHTVAEATVIIEYIDTVLSADRRLLPSDPAIAWKARMWDRFFDLYIHVPMQQIVGDALRPAGAKDPAGVAQAEAQITQAFGMIEHEMAGRTWWMGDDYGLVDCTASPPLFYANTVMPIDRSMKNLAGYFDRLMARPSYARVLREAQPHFDLFPLAPKPQLPKEAA